MSVSKYRVVKKQISHDKGITWEDTEPLEYCDPVLVDVYPSMAACEDTDCDLEKFEYDIVDGELPTEICYGEQAPPFGIVKRITFTDGLVACGYNTGALWTYSPPENISMIIQQLSITDRNGYISVDINGGIAYNNCAWNCCSCCDVCSCYRIDEFMPWVGNTLKYVRKTRWTREHCSEEWVKDEAYGDELLNIAERWVPEMDYANNTIKWYHHMVTSVDSGGTQYWSQIGEPISYRFFDLPQGATLKESTDNTFTFRYDNGTPNSTPTLCRLGEVYTVKIGVTRTCDNDWNNYPIISGIYAGQTGSGVRYPYDNLRYCSDGSTFTKWWYYQHLQSWNNMGTVNNGSYTYSTFGPIHTYLQRPEEGYDYRYVTSNACLNGNVTLNGSSKWVISSTNTINIKFAYFTTLYTFRRQLFDNILIPAVLNGEDILLDTRHRRYYTPTTSGEYSYMPQHVVNF